MSGVNEHTSPGEKESCPEPRPGQSRLLCPPQASLSRTRPADTTGAGGTAEQCQPQSTHPDTCCYQGEGAQGAWPSRQTRATSMGRGRSALGAHRKLQGRLSSSSAQNATPEPNREPTDLPTWGSYTQPVSKGRREDQGGLPAWGEGEGKDHLGKAAVWMSQDRMVCTAGAS